MRQVPGGFIQALDLCRQGETGTGYDTLKAIGEADMPNQNTLKAFLVAFLATVVVAVVAILVAAVVSASGRSAGGIGAYAGGVSSSFINLLAIALPALFVIAFLIFRRSQR